MWKFLQRHAIYPETNSRRLFHARQKRSSPFQASAFQAVTSAVDVSRLLTENRVCFSPSFDLSDQDLATSALFETRLEESLNDISTLIACHPFPGSSLEAIFSRNEAKAKLVQRCLDTRGRSRETLVRILAEYENPSIPSASVPADILLKKASKFQVSLLVDKQVLGEKHDGFYLCSVDSLASRSWVRNTVWGRSLKFSNLRDRLLNDQEVEVSCTQCGRVSNAATDAAVFKCCVPPTSTKSLHSHRLNYPVLPNMDNVWIGRADRVVDAVGSSAIIHCTVFQLFGSKKQKPVLPSPDPRTEWVLFPFK
jgi:hypothetical protein